ncbi:MAG: LuxR C-terminal-related transcriptional regulator [Planctomycetota bacterium]
MFWGRSEGLEIRIINLDISALTERERQVLAMIGRGYSIPKIAEKLFRSQKTIETHRHSLGRKLGVSNRVELARIAIQTGLAPLELEDINASASLTNSQNPRSRLGDDLHAAELVHRIEWACAGVVGLTYARVLCESLSQELGTTGAGILSHETEQNAIRSLALLYRGEWVDGVSFPYVGSPCEQAISKEIHRCDGTFPECFPDIDPDSRFGIKSYLGVGLVDPLTQESIGTLALFLDEATASFDLAAETVLQVCAQRTAAELGRMRLIDSLQRSVESLEQRLATLEQDEAD